jgi:gluconolactonase
VLYTECDGHKLIGPNDLVFDAQGGMWFTDHARRAGRVEHLGAIYYAQPDGSSIREVVFPVHAPNGIGLSPDDAVLYAAETHTGRVFAWSITAPGEVETTVAGATGALLCGLPGMQLFDSLGIDGDGNVVVATLVSGALTVISPKGEVLDQVATGDPMTTNVCFGGPDLKTAYVTCSGTGRLISLPWERPGLPLHFLNR